MQARRILLIFAIVLLLSAAAASVVPVPEQPERGTTQGSTEPTESPPPPRPDDDVTEVTFDARSKRRTETVESGKHVVVTVRAGEPGQVRIEGLGRFGDVAPLVPARFDLFTDRKGSFDVVYTPVEGEPRRVGTLVVGAGSTPLDAASEAAEPRPHRSKRSSSR